MAPYTPFLTSAKQPGRYPAPSLPVRPETGRPLGFTTPVGPSIDTAKGGVVVESRHPDALLGARQANHRQDVARIIAAYPNHPMRPPIDEATVSTGAPRYVRPPCTPGAPLQQWPGIPTAGGPGTLAANGPATPKCLWRNPLGKTRQCCVQEGEGIGADPVTMDQMVVIGDRRRPTVRRTDVDGRLPEPDARGARRTASAAALRSDAGPAAGERRSESAAAHAVDEVVIGDKLAVPLRICRRRAPG